MPGGGSQTEGELMRQTLEHDFNVPVAYVETRSLTTWDNAINTAAMLRHTGIRKILLVTHACDERRAALVFRRQGFDVIPAATVFAGIEPGDPYEYLPSMHSLLGSTWALHEWLGLLWYKLRIHFEGST
jgi:uncharacterized SAM-binding protein YcdF (DUF218 family)